MKIIFLDIDGVFIHLRYAASIGEKGLLKTFDPTVVNLINLLCETTNAKCVIHSNWRRNVERTALLSQLNSAGLKHLHSDWECPMKLSSPKAYDIHMWLRDHPETTKFIIVDDNKVGIKPEVRTTWENGFLYEHYLRIKEYLS